MDAQNKNIKELLQNLTQADFEKGTDLHMHSCFSDGKLSPEELLQDAQKKVTNSYPSQTTTLLTVIKKLIF